ncbi:MAG: hypothetical protein J3K34DRAFT_246321 [Monoraphidium minutum]|nr:MAG: hypothetical protein J3K34DRAFT_246321 [Monoraphidium minutum]
MAGRVTPPLTSGTHRAAYTRRACAAAAPSAAARRRARGAGLLVRRKAALASPAAMRARTARNRAARACACPTYHPAHFQDSCSAIYYRLSDALSFIVSDAKHLTRSPTFRASGNKARHPTRGAARRAPACSIDSLERRAAAPSSRFARRPPPHAGAVERLAVCRLLERASNGTCIHLVGPTGHVFICV